MLDRRSLQIWTCALDHAHLWWSRQIQPHSIPPWLLTPLSPSYFPFLVLLSLPFSPFFFFYYFFMIDFLLFLPAISLCFPIRKNQKTTRRRGRNGCRPSPPPPFSNEKSRDESFLPAAPPCPLLPQIHFLKGYFVSWICPARLPLGKFYLLCF